MNADRRSDGFEDAASVRAKQGSASARIGDALVIRGREAEAPQASAKDGETNAFRGTSSNRPSGSCRGGCSALGGAIRTLRHPPASSYSQCQELFGVVPKSPKLLPFIGLASCFFLFLIKGSAYLFLQNVDAIEINLMSYEKYTLCPPYVRKHDIRWMRKVPFWFYPYSFAVTYF